MRRFTGKGLQELFGSRETSGNTAVMILAVLIALFLFAAAMIIVITKKDLSRTKKQTKQAVYIQEQKGILPLSSL